MKMTLKNFMDSSGIPKDDTYYMGNPKVFGGMVACVKYPALLNQSIRCGLPTRLRRRAYYRYNLAGIPVRKDAMENRLLFWGRHDGDIQLRSLHALFDQLPRWPGREYEVVVGGTDDTFDQSYAEKIPGNLRRLFAVNCNVAHEKVQWYPLGRDPRGIDFFDMPPSAGKHKLVYANFSHGTHASRERIWSLIKDRDFISRVHISGNGWNSGYPLSMGEFLAQLNDHAFSVCPRGRGFDTLRLWDSLHLGVVPIVVKEAFFHDYLKDLPILFLDSVDQFGDLTQSYLENVYREMLGEKYDFSVLTAGYWRRIFAGDWHRG